MATTYPDLRAALATILPWLLPVRSTCTSNGTTSTLVDTLFKDANTQGLTADSAASMWVLRPSAGAAADRERRIDSLAVATGTLTVQDAWANAPSSGEAYEIWAIQPRIAFNLLLVTMEQFLQPTYGPVTTGRDEDMEATGTTSYSAPDGGTLAKETGAALVDTGTQSLKFSAAGANDYAKSDDHTVSPGVRYEVSAAWMVTAGGPVAFAVWDETNSAEIDATDRVSHSQPSFLVGRRFFTAPEGCFKVSLRWYCTTGSDVVYIDRYFGPHAETLSVLSAPSWLTTDVQLRKVMRADYLQAVEGDAGRLYTADSRVFDDSWRLYRNRDYFLRPSHYHANPYRIELRQPYPQGELWVEALRKASEITTFAYTAAGESSPTTTLDKRLIALDWAVRCCRYALNNNPSDEEAAQSLSQYVTRQGDRDVPFGEYADLLVNYRRDLQSPVQRPAYAWS